MTDVIKIEISEKEIWLFNNGMIVFYMLDYSKEYKTKDIIYSIIKVLKE